MFFYLQAHPWFKGTEWDKLYQIKAAFIPEVNDELDTQNFEKFEEVDSIVGLAITSVYTFYILFFCSLFLPFMLYECRVTTKFPPQQKQALGERLVRILV